MRWTSVECIYNIVVANLASIPDVPNLCLGMAESLAMPLLYVVVEKRMDNKIKGEQR